jgi:hypothetical protein
MKLSSKQIEVLKLMKEGWELGIDTDGWRSTLGRRTARLQKDGLGKGGLVTYFRAIVIDALEHKGFIMHKINQYPTITPTVYYLTEKGKEVII